MKQKDRKKDLKRYEKLLSVLLEMNEISKGGCEYAKHISCEYCPLNYGIEEKACQNLKHPWAECITSAIRIQKNLKHMIELVKRDITLNKALNIKKRRSLNSNG